MTRDDAFPIKICGLSTPETLEAALAAGADMIGLNFHPKSPRYVTPAQAAELGAQARGKTAVVALVVDYAPEQAAELARIVRPDWMQLHGKETPEQVAAIKAATGLPVMKALGVANAVDLEQAALYHGRRRPHLARTPSVPAPTSAASSASSAAASSPRR
jgi:phosphoribosylanthranilate isomerase